jgi:RES domain-containing protein
MSLAYRIVRQKFAATAFTGEGAALAGGRWNSLGTRMVYCSATASLAALETLVHLNPAMCFTYSLYPIEFDERLIEKIARANLPSDWRDEPPPPSTKRIGDAWARESRSAVLQLPSVIIPVESNYLFNTSHPDYRTIRIGKPEPFAFDTRMIP